MKISIVIPTLNNQKEIKTFFSYLRRQVFPTSKLEIIAVDGGSKDSTVSQLRKHRAKVVPNPYVLAEPGVSIGIARATGDIVMVLAMDNFFYDPHALLKIAEIFRDQSVYAAFPKQNYDTTDNLFTKYHNTFTDPFNHFVQGDAANARTFKRVYKTLVHNDIYDVYDFNSQETIPMISLSQGFTLRKSFKRKKDDLFDDNSPVIYMIKKNKKIAYIHSVSIYHHTIRDLNHFIKKQRWATRNALDKKNYGISHRYQQLSAEQKLRIKLWPFYAYSIVFPFINSVVGLIRDRKLVWLFHPINCFLCAYASTIELLTFIIGKMGLKIKVISRQ